MPCVIPLPAPGVMHSTVFPSLRELLTVTVATPFVIVNPEASNTVGCEKVPLATFVNGVANPASVTVIVPGSVVPPTLYVNQ